MSNILLSDFWELRGMKMGTTLEKDMVIKTLSQKLLFELVETVPLGPNLGTLELRAEGIKTSVPWHGDGDNRARYDDQLTKYHDEQTKVERECAQKGIIPYARCEVSYNVQNKTFERKLFYDHPETTWQNFDPYLFSLEQIIGEGKPGRVSVCITKGTYAKIKELVGALKTIGYHISSGSLRLMSSSPHDGSGSLDETKLYIDKNVRLVIEHDNPKIKELTDWFNAVKSKYEPNT